MASEKCRCGCCGPAEVEEAGETQRKTVPASRLRFIQLADRLAEIDESLAKLDRRVA
jgi:hypothetical protein